MLPHFQGSHLHWKSGKMRKVFPVREKSGNLKILLESPGILGKSEKIISENINVYYMKMIKKNSNFSSKFYTERK